MQLWPRVARDTTNHRQVLHQIWCDKIHNCQWSVKTTTLFFYSPDTYTLPCLPHSPSVPLRSPYLHTFSLVSASLIPPVWSKRMGSGFVFYESRQRLHAGEHPTIKPTDVTSISGIQTEDKDGNSWMDLTDFSHFLVCVWSVWWCKHIWTLGTLAQGHSETFARHCQYCGLHQQPFKLLKNANNKKERLEGKAN